MVGNRAAPRPRRRHRPPMRRRQGRCSLSYAARSRPCRSTCHRLRGRARAARKGNGESGRRHRPRRAKARQCRLHQAPPEEVVEGERGTAQRPRRVRRSSPRHAAARSRGVMFICSERQAAPTSDRNRAAREPAQKKSRTEEAKSGLPRRRLLFSGLSVCTADAAARGPWPFRAPRGEFHLSGTEIGILTGLPIILFAAAALVGSRLVALLGVTRAVITGLALTAAGRSARRDRPPRRDDAHGCGIAVTQPAGGACRPLVARPHRPRHRHLQRIDRWRNPAGCAFPIPFRVFGQSWRATFVFWALPIVAIASRALTAEKPAAIGAARRRWPNWPAREVLRRPRVRGGERDLFRQQRFSSRLSERDRPRRSHQSGAHRADVGQLPASLLLIVFARHLERGRGRSQACCAWRAGAIVATAGAVTVAGAGAASHLLLLSAARRTRACRRRCSPSAIQTTSALV